jgi:hypothetical protein
METRTSHRIVSRLLRLGVSSTSGSSSDEPTALGELETELALLREENAWLKVERHRAPDAGRIVERMRELAQAARAQVQQPDSSESSEAAQAMVECIAIRDALLEACEEIQQAMQGIRSRLSGLSVDVHGKNGDGAVSSPVATPSTGEVDLNLVRETRASSELSQSAT